MKPLEPKSIFANRFEIVRSISTGGMGAVYEVIHRETKRRRALKVMLPSMLVDDEMRRRFALEAVITAEISSEHLVEVFDAGIESDTACPFIVMELLDGEDLGKYVAKRGPLPAEEVAEILTQVAHALDKTHAAGIVHRDLKPDNLFRTTRDDGSPKVKILDFGIAKLLATQGGPTTRAMGTPLFMAPEQVDDGLARIGPAVDLFALGQIAFALLVGVPYFSDDAKRADNLLSMLLTVARGPTDSATRRAEKLGRSAPANFDAWFAKATARDPSERFTSARAMSDAFARDVASKPSELVAQGKTSPEPEAQPPRRLGRFDETEPLMPEAADTPSAPPRASAVAGASGEQPGAASANNTASLGAHVRSAQRPAGSGRGALIVAGVVALGAGVAIALASLEPSAPAGQPEPGAGRAAATTPSSAQQQPPLVQPNEQAASSSAAAGADSSASAIPAGSAAATASAKSAPLATQRGPRDLKPPPSAPVASTAKPTSTLQPWEVRTPVKP